MAELNVPAGSKDSDSASLAPRRRDFWAPMERVVRVLSLLAIPIVIAVLGSMVQRSLAEQNLRRDYVQLAVSILMRAEGEVDPGLRSWAVELVNENSPVKFTAEVTAQLASGVVSFPRALGDVLTRGPAGVAITPDGEVVATGDETGLVTTWNLLSGEPISSLAGHQSAIVALSFSPDGEYLLSASLDGTVHLWDVETGQSLLRVQADGPILGAVISPDGGSFLTRGRDGTVRTWSATTGTLLEARALGVRMGAEG